MQGIGKGVTTTLAALLFSMAALCGPASAAITPDETLKDPKLEARARAIGKQLRCMVCQNQSIDDSDAPLAKDLRRIVREQITKGETDEQVIAHIHQRYGDFVLLRPPVRPGTWPLWYGPAALLLIAVLFMGWRLRRRRVVADEPLSALEEVQVAKLLAGGNSQPKNTRPKAPTGSSG